MGESRESTGRKALSPAPGAGPPASAAGADAAAGGLDLPQLIPDHFARYFAFFRPGHQAGIVPVRIKELARLKIAALNGCDT